MLIFIKYKAKWQYAERAGVIFFVWIGPSALCERINFYVQFWTGKLLEPLLNFFTTHARPYLNKLSASADKHSMTPYKEMETLLPPELCQSRINGHNGTTACTVISCIFVQRFLQGEASLATAEGRLDAAKQSMLLVNLAYDDEGVSGCLHVDAVLDMQAVDLVLSGEKFVKKDTLQAVAELLTAAATDVKTSGGVLVVHPFLFAVCYDDGQIILSDSHSHGRQGGLLAVVPVAQFQSYMSHFFMPFILTCTSVILLVTTKLHIFHFCRCKQAENLCPCHS